MSKLPTLSILILLLLMTAIICIGCDEFDANYEKSVRDNFLVDKIYDYNDNLLAEYFYDKNNRLTKRIVTKVDYHPLRITDWRLEDIFEYKNGRVSKIHFYMRTLDTYTESDFENLNESRYVINYEYDSKGNLKKCRDFSYRYEKGRVAGMSRNQNGPFCGPDTIVYDHSGNVCQHIYIGPEVNNLGEPIAGTSKRVVYHFEYDNNPKLNFGLDYLYSYQPLPHMETDVVGEMILSKNNMTKTDHGGYTWVYTYNENGLPATIGALWNGKETIERKYKITYKQIY